MKPKTSRKKEVDAFKYIKKQGKSYKHVFKKTASCNICQVRGEFPNTERSITNQYVKDNQLISRCEQLAHNGGKYEWPVNIKRCLKEMQCQAK